MLGIILTSLLHLTVNIAIVVAMVKDINTVVDAHERLYGENSVYATYSVFLWITMVFDLVVLGAASYTMIC
jgi:hypothetical protein